MVRIKRSRRSWPVLASVLALAACESRAPEWPFPGTLERERIEIRAESAETIRSIAVREGDLLAPDALIAQQDEQRTALREAAALAEHARIAAQLDELIAGPRPELIAEAKARRARAHSLRIEAGQQYARVEELARKGTASAAERERVQALKLAAEADLAAADASLAALLAGTRSETIAAARAALEAAVTQIELTRIDRQRLALRAPRASIVEQVLVEPGDRPLPGEVVAVLVPQTPPYARVYVPSALRGPLKPGSACEVRLAHDQGTLPGRLRWMAGEAGFTPYYALAGEDAGRASFLAEIELVDAPESLPSGLPLSARCGEPM